MPPTMIKVEQQKPCNLLCEDNLSESQVYIPAYAGIIIFICNNIDVHADGSQSATLTLIDGSRVRHLANATVNAVVLCVCPASSTVYQPLIVNYNATGLTWFNTFYWSPWFVEPLRHQ